MLQSQPKPGGKCLSQTEKNYEYLTYLIPIRICLPIGQDTILLCNIFTLRQQFLVRNCLLSLSTSFLYELFRRQFCFTELLWLNINIALGVRDNLQEELMRVCGKQL